jgi:MFS family permease
MGNGLTLSLFVIYLTHMRHISTFAATLVLSWEAIVGLCISPLYGTLVDRYGPSPVLAVSLPIASVGVMLISVIANLAQAFGVATLVAAGSAGAWSALSTLMTRIVPVERRQDAFGLNFMLINLGIALGAMVGASFVSLHSLRTFQVMYVVCGFVLLAQAGTYFTLRRFGGPPAEPEHRHEVAEGWRVVLSDRRLLRFLAASTLLAICGYGQIEAGIQLFVVNVLKLPVRAIGALFVFNTLTIVIGQVFMLAAIRGKSRTRLVGVLGLLWAASWVLAACALLTGKWGAFALMCAGQVVFAIGETIWAPVGPALINDLAAEHLRGRYNALSGLTWQMAGTVGPLVAGLLLSGGHGAAWALTLIAGCTVGGLAATTLRARLTPEEDGRVLAAA